MKKRNIIVIVSIIFLVVFLFSLLMILSSYKKNEDNEEIPDQESADYEMEELSLSSIGDAQVGDVVELGSYILSSDSNEKERLTWDVLDKKDGSLLLVSHNVIETLPFNRNSSKKNEGWADSYIRSWLNSDFYNEAFDDEEKKRIILSVVDNPDSSEMFEMLGEHADIKDNESTEDYLFLLSWKEAFEYYDVELVDNNESDSGVPRKEKMLYSEKLIAKPTPFCAQKMYDQRVKNCEDSGIDASKAVYPLTSDWALRSDYANDLMNMRVSDEGDIRGVFPTSDVGVRPAMWVKVEKLTLQYVCEKYDMDESEFDGVDFDAFVEYYGLTVDNMGATGPRFLLSKYKELKYKVKVPEYNIFVGNTNVFLDEYAEHVELVIVEEIKEVGGEQSCNTIVFDLALGYELLSHKPLLNSEFSESDIVKEIDDDVKNKIFSCFKNNNFSSIKKQKQNEYDDENSQNDDLYHVIVKLDDGTIYEIDEDELSQDDESKKAFSGFIDDIERLAE